MINDTSINHHRVNRISIEGRGFGVMGRVICTPPPQRVPPPSLSIWNLALGVVRRPYKVCNVVLVRPDPLCPQDAVRALKQLEGPAQEGITAMYLMVRHRVDWKMVCQPPLTHRDIMCQKRHCYITLTPQYRPTLRRLKRVPYSGSRLYQDSHTRVLSYQAPQVITTGVRVISLTTRALICTWSEERLRGWGAVIAVGSMGRPRYETCERCAQVAGYLHPPVKDTW